MTQAISSTRHIDISFLSGNFLLKGVLHLPDRKYPPVVIGSHGLLANKNSPKQIALAKMCNALGMAYFRFDYRACGDSQGVYLKDTSFEARCEDLLNAIKIVRQGQNMDERMGLFGSSLGGAVSLAIAGGIHIDSLVTFAAPIRSKELYLPDNKTVMPSPNLKSTQNIQLKFDISNRLSSIRHTLIIHGQQDTVVPLSHAYEIFKGVNTPKQLIIQNDGDHGMSNEVHQKEFIQQASYWFKEGLFNK